MTASLGLILTLTTGALWTLVGIIYSRAAGNREQYVSFMFFSTLIFAGICWLLHFPQAAPTTEILRVAAIMLPAGICGQLGFLVLCRAMRSGPHGIAWGLSQAALLCPFLTGWLLLDGQVQTSQKLGLLLLLGALPLIAVNDSAGNSAGSRLFPWLCLGALGLLGMEQSLALVPGHCRLSPAALSWRLPFYSLAGLGWGLPLLLRKAKFFPGQWRPAAVYGIVIALGQFSLYAAIDRMTAVGQAGLVHPLAIGSCILFFFFYCRWFRQEQSSRRRIAGILLLILSLILLS